MLEHLTNIVARTRVELDTAAVAHARDSAEVARLAARADVARTRQAEITRRRLADQSTDKEAAEYAALAGDLAVLNDLLAEARSRAQASEPTEQRAVLARAEADLREATEGAAFDATVERAREAERVYIAHLRAVWAAAKGRGHRRTFGEVYTVAEPIMSLCRLNAWSYAGGGEQ